MKKMSEYNYHSGITGGAFPSRRQFEVAKKWGGSDRFVYNKLVAVNNELYKLQKVKTYIKPVAERIDYLKESINSAKNIRNAAPFLNDVSIDVVNNAIKKYHAAWQHFREGYAGIPTFHKKGYDFSFQVNPHYSKGKTSIFECAGVYFVDKTHMVLPGIGKIRVKFSKKKIEHIFKHPSDIRIGTVTFHCDATGKCFISLQLASDIPFVEPYDKTGKAEGIDLNIENFYATSEGDIYDNPSYYKASSKRLKKMQKKMSRRAERAKKDGKSLREAKNYQKQRVKVAKLHKKVANQREDFQQKAAVRELKNHDAVYAENLKVKNMVKNHCLAKAISDVSWGSFLNILKIKALMRGKIFKQVNPRNTTQTCNKCKHVMSGDERLTLKDREWTCPECGTFHVRDINAAINILNKGLET